MSRLMILAWLAAVLGPPLIVWLLRRPEQRRSVPRRVLAGVLALGWACGVWGFLIEPETLVVRHVTIDSPGWRGPPLRIGVISDLHIDAPHMTGARAERVIDRLARERPDLVAVLGDFAGGHRPAAERGPARNADIARGVGALGRLKPPLGTWAVMGNHDWTYSRDLISDELSRAGVHVIDERVAEVARPGGGFRLVGVDGAPEQRWSPNARTAAAADPAGPPLLVLSHYPDPWPQVPSWAALTLAAHTHCGQVNLPFVGRLVAASPGGRRWPCGLYVEEGRRMYVTGGVGVSILPVRFGAPPEVVIVTLRATRKP